MITATEAASGKTPMGAALDAGVAAISYDQKITFTQYRRTVLPADGFIFWVKAGSTTMTVQGSLHFSTLVNQTEADSAATNTLIFTAREAVQNLDATDPGKLWVAEFEGVKFAFRERSMRYQQSGLHHYRGVALYATLDTQLVDSAADLPGLVVSDSLPIWLTMTQFGTVYPSFAVPANLPPPYIAAHIVPGSTQSLAMQPWIDAATSSSWQLTAETVRFTLYGLDNDEAIDFQNYIFQGSLADDDPYGIMGTSMPTIQDERQTQPEMQILAQRKTFAVDVSYYQARVQTIASRYILHAMLNLTISPNIP